MMDLEFTTDERFYLVTEREGKKVKVLLDLRIFPKDMAKESVVGEARQEPNFEPYLPPPIGRIQFTLNPWKMLL